MPLRYRHFLSDTYDDLLLNRIQLPAFLDELRLILATPALVGSAEAVVTEVIDCAEEAARRKSVS
ncbi:hypothetical protein BH24ACT9_BH24ACT9_18840 [soil metagenome]